MGESSTRPLHEGNHGAIIPPPIHHDSRRAKGRSEDSSKCLNHRVVARTLEDQAMGAAGEVTGAKGSNGGVGNGRRTAVTDSRGGSGGRRAGGYGDWWEEHEV